MLEKPVWLDYEQLVPPEGQLIVELRLYGTPDLTLPNTVTIEVSDVVSRTTETFTLNINEGPSSGPNDVVDAADTGGQPPADNPTPTETPTVTN